MKLTKIRGVWVHPSLRLPQCPYWDGSPALRERLFMEWATSNVSDSAWFKWRFSWARRWRN